MENARPSIDNLPPDRELSETEVERIAAALQPMIYEAADKITKRGGPPPWIVELLAFQQTQRDTHQTAQAVKGATSDWIVAGLAVAILLAFSWWTHVTEMQYLHSLKERIIATEIDVQDILREGRNE